MKKYLLAIAFVTSFFITAQTPIQCTNEYDWIQCDNNNVIDGYWWRGSWVPGLPTYGSQFLELPDLFTGIAVFYGPNVMEGTARYRGLSLDDYLGGVALPTCSGIGSPVWIKREGQEWEGPYLVVDCARRNDLYGIAIVRGEAVEIDFNTALRWGMAEQYADYTWKPLKWSEDVSVSRFPPKCISEVSVSLKEWIEPRIEYAPWVNSLSIIYKPPSTWRVDGEWMVFNNQKTCNINSGT